MPGGPPLAPVTSANGPSAGFLVGGEARTGLHVDLGSHLTAHKVPGIQAKNLIGLPWRVAFALQDDGWILRNAIAWHKPTAIP